MTPEEEAFRLQLEQDMTEWARSIQMTHTSLDNALRSQRPPPPTIQETFNVFPAHSFPRQQRQTTPVPLRTSGCPTATLVCDSISASKTKCGFSEQPGYVSTPPKIYVNYHEKYHSHSTNTSGPCDITVDYDIYATLKCDTCFNKIFGPFYDDIFDPEPGFIGCFNITGTRSSPPECFNICSPPVVTNTNTSVLQRTDYGCTNDTGSLTRYFYREITDEYTTSNLETDTEGILPVYAGFGGPYDAGQSDYCSAFRDLSSDESSYSIRRFKYKFTFPPACEGMKVLWTKRFIPTLAADVTFEGTLYHAGDPDPDPSHWTDTEMSWPAVGGAAGGETATSVYEELEPEENGTTSLVNVSVDCSDCPEDASRTTFAEIEQ